MTIEARPVVKNKYWIVEKDGRKIATIQAADDGVVLVEGEQRSKYPSIRVLGTAHNIRFVNSKRRAQVSENSVYEYPCSSSPYNAIYDLKLRLPLYTTTRKSKSFYCAGYYLVQYENHWLTEFCPKKIILTRNRFIGPFRTEQDMLDKLHSLNTHK
jgi:hypothetical protein